MPALGVEVEVEVEGGFFDLPHAQAVLVEFDDVGQVVCAKADVATERRAGRSASEGEISSPVRLAGPP